MSDKIEFTLVDSGGLDNEHWGIHIDTGKFVGIIFNFGTVKYAGDDDDGNAIIRFDYDIIEDSLGFAETDKQEFEQALGNILHSILEDSVKEEADGKNRNSSTKESSSL